MHPPWGRATESSRFSLLDSKDMAASISRELYWRNEEGEESEVR